MDIHNIPYRMKDEEGLCCCEYINENEERSHLLAAICNCEAIDETFERLISSQEVKPGLGMKILNTIEDRLRLPWPGGAKKFPLHFAIPLTVLPAIILLGTINLVFSFVSYLLILPFTFYIGHKLIRMKRHNSLNRILPPSQNKNYFYPFWLLLSIFFLLIIYYTQIIGALKVSSEENFKFLVLFVSSGTCLYITMKMGQLDLASRNEILNLRMINEKPCPQCSLNVPEVSSHCKLCRSCFAWRDHHCLWLNTCIGKINERWFLAGLSLALGCLVYGEQILFTTVCHPRVYRVAFVEVLLPLDCDNAYVDFSHALAISAGCYGIVMSFCIALLLILQAYSVSFRFRRQNQNAQIKARNVFRIFMNWKNIFL